MSYDNYDLTICSVSFHSIPYLTLNWELTQKLNNGEKSYRKWIAVENTPGEEDDKLSLNDERFEVMQGVDVPQMKPAIGSYHHAAALNMARSRINQTRFVLFLDPDFYIVRQNWIRDVLDYMINNDLGFLGVPWHPRWYSKYRYFPCVHCLFIDLNKVPLQCLDFMPEFDQIPEQENDKGFAPIEELKRQIPMHLYRLLRPVVRACRPLNPVAHWISRKAIGSSRDTGYRIFRRYSQNRCIRHECVVPVFKPESDFRGPAYVLSLWGRLAEAMLPDHLRYIPRRAGYYSQLSFLKTGYPDISSMGVEEFIWKGSPFGFHVRSNAQDRSTREQLIMSLQSVLSNIDAINYVT
jgi:hypothetical protein